MAVAKFAHDGPREPDIEEVGRATGVASSELRAIFRSEDALVGEACTEATLTLTRPVSAAGALAEPWADRVAAAIGGLLGAVAEEPLLAELCLLHTRRFVGARTGLGREAVVSALEEVIADGVSQTVASVADPSSLVGVVAAGTVAVVAGSTRPPSGAAEEFRAELVELTLRPFCGAAEARRFARGLPPDP